LRGRSLQTEDAPVEIPETRYAIASDGAYLAYQLFGDGPVDLLYIPGFASHLEVYWEFPQVARFLRRLGRVARVILFDKRGTGLSDRVTRAADLETMMDDVRSVLDAVGSHRTVLWGDGLDGGGTCAIYTASFPDRVAAFIWWQAIAVWEAADPEYPWGFTAEETERFRTEIKQHWGKESGSATLLRLVGGPSMADDPAWQRLYAKLCRYAATPGGAIALDAMWDGLDLRNILPTVRVPTLVVKRKEEDEPEGRYIASRIPGARLAVLSECNDFTPTLGDQDEIFEVVTSFLDSVRQEESEFDRILATVLFTDIVDSTVKAVELGDRRWKALVEDHHARVRAVLSRYRGHEIDTAGDGFFASFDGPARAVRCGKALTQSVRELGIEVRVGVHTGECELIDGKPGGASVVVGARIGALADPGEVLTSQTVKELVAGSGLVFEDRGEHDLKGVPDRWRLYRVAD